MFAQEKANLIFTHSWRRTQPAWKDTGDLWGFVKKEWELHGEKILDNWEKFATTIRATEPLIWRYCEWLLYSITEDFFKKKKKHISAISQLNI